MRTLIKTVHIVRYHGQRRVVRLRFAAQITADITERRRQLTGHCCCTGLSHHCLHCHWYLLTSGRSRARRQQLTTATTTTTTAWSLLATGQQRHHSQWTLHNAQQLLKMTSATGQTQQKAIFSPSLIHQYSPQVELDADADVCLQLA